MIKHIILIGIFLASCTQTIPPTSVDCTAKFDSINTYWRIQLADCEADSLNRIKWEVRDSVQWADSTRWTTDWVDSINWIDSVKWSDPEPEELVKLHPISTSDNHHFEDNVVENLFDDDLSARWLDSTYSQLVGIDFGEIVFIETIRISSFKALPITVEINNIENKQRDTLTTTTEVWSEHEINYTGGLFYLRTITGENSWSDLNELEFWGYRLNSREE